MGKKFVIVLLLGAGALLALYVVSSKINHTGAGHEATASQEAPPSEPEPVAIDPAGEEYPGVNLDFYDEPKVQIGWMKRAEVVINNNLPDIADRAEVRNTFFHRGFKGWAVTCGEVELHRDGEVAVDYQRFVFPGVQTIYYENDIKNFHIYWDKMCVDLEHD